MERLCNKTHCCWPLSLFFRQYVRSVGSQITWTKNVCWFPGEDVESLWVPSNAELLFVVSRWSRQRNGKWCLPRSAESGERAKPGGHGGRGLDAAGLEASEGGFIFLLGQSSREPQKEEEQEQTQVYNTHLNWCVIYRISLNKVFLILHLFPIWFQSYLARYMKTYADKNCIFLLHVCLSETVVSNLTLWPVPSATH